MNPEKLPAFFMEIGRLAAANHILCQMLTHTNVDIQAVIDSALTLIEDSVENIAVLACDNEGEE